jgi:hypothetical protein
MPKRVHDDTMPTDSTALHSNKAGWPARIAYFVVLAMALGGTSVFVVFSWFWRNRAIDWYCSSLGLSALLTVLLLIPFGRSLLGQAENGSRQVGIFIFLLFLSPFAFLVVCGVVCGVSESVNLKTYR